MAKSVKNESPANDGAGKEDLESLVQSGQASPSAAPSPSSPPAPPPAAEGKAKAAARDYANETRRSGDKCPRLGCHGVLTVMSTHRGKEYKIRHLSCNSCKLVGGKEVVPL